MKTKDFFTHHIKDNNYEGLPLLSIKELNKTGENSAVKIYNYIRALHLKFSSSNIIDIAKTITFGEEFEANEEQKLFELKGNDFESAKIFTFNLVGTIYYKKRTFSVNSRFGDKFLQYMISSSNGFLEIDNTGGISNDVSLAEWIVIYYFKIKLKDAFGIGMYKNYASKSEDLMSIRGRIDINHFIKKEYFDGKTRCNYKEHSYSNEINYIISLAINKIFKTQKYNALIQDIHTIKNAFNQIEYRKRNIVFLKNKKVTNPFYSKYNEVYKLAYKILDDNFGSFGEQEEFSAFLFDISLLFEHHIRSLLKTKYNLGIKNSKDFKIPNGNGHSPIYPDIIIYHDDGSISIYDVKYKNFGNEVNRDDRYQLISYVAIYMQKYIVKECGFIYPSNKDKKDKKQELYIANKIIPFKILFYNISNDSKNFIEVQKNKDINFIEKLEKTK